MRLPVFFSRVSSSATGTNRPGQCAKAVGNNVSKRACSFHSLRAGRRYSALQSRWSKPKPARMRVSVAVPTTVNEPKACRRARRKLRSCRNTGRHRETSARKRVSSTAVWPWLYFYQASTQVHQPPIENVQTPGALPAPALLMQAAAQGAFTHETAVGLSQMGRQQRHGPGGGSVAVLTWVLGQNLS